MIRNVPHKKYAVQEDAVIPNAGDEAAADGESANDDAHVEHVDNDGAGVEAVDIDDDDGFPPFVPLKKRKMMAKIDVDQIKTEIEESTEKIKVHLDQKISIQTQEIKLYVSSVIEEAKAEIKEFISSTFSKLTNALPQAQTVQLPLVELGDDSFSRLCATLDEPQDHSSQQFRIPVGTSRDNATMQQVSSIIPLNTAKSAPVKPTLPSITPTPVPVNSFVSLPTQVPAPRVASAGASVNIIKQQSVSWSELREESNGKRDYFAYKVLCAIFEEEELPRRCCRGSKKRAKLDATKLKQVKDIVFGYFPLNNDENERNAWSDCIKNIDSRLRKRFPTKDDNVSE